jgi:hypothetical protein
MASWMLLGLQNALLRMARANTRHQEIALYYSTQLLGPILSFVCQVCKSGKTSNIDFESTNNEDAQVSISNFSFFLHFRLNYPKMKKNMSFPLYKHY